MEWIFSAWGRILTGYVPALSIEITRECPLRCPGCYAYGDDHLGGDLTLRQVRDFKGQELIDGVIALVDRHRPLHVSIVGGEPLVRYRELTTILPRLSERGPHAARHQRRVIPLPDLARLQANLIASQTVGVGPAMSREETRALMMARAQTLALGYSGLRRSTLQLLLDMINRGVHPVIPAQGSVGASGDLAPLSHMASAMMGGRAWPSIGGADPARRRGAGRGRPGAGRAIAKEGLALCNGTSQISGLLALATADAANLVAGRRHLRRAELRGAGRASPPRSTRASMPPAASAARGRRRPPARPARRERTVWHDSALDGRMPRERRHRPPAQGAGRLLPALHAAGARPGARRAGLCARHRGDRTERRGG